MSGQCMIIIIRNCSIIQNYILLTHMGPIHFNGCQIKETFKSNRQQRNRAKFKME